MEVVQKIVYVACFMGVATVIVEAIEPSDKFRKQIRLIFSLIFAIGIITPIVSGKISFDSKDVLSVGSATEYINLNSEVDRQLAESIQKNIETSLVTKLRENQIECEKISVSINIDEETGIIINKVSLSSQEPDKAVSIIKAQLGDDINVLADQSKNVKEEGG